MDHCKYPVTWVLEGNPADRPPDGYHLSLRDHLSQEDSGNSGSTSHQGGEGGSAGSAQEDRRRGLSGRRDLASGAALTVACDQYVAPESFRTVPTQEGQHRQCSGQAEEPDQSRPGYQRRQWE